MPLLFTKNTKLWPVSSVRGAGKCRSWGRRGTGRGVGRAKVLTSVGEEGPGGAGDSRPDVCVSAGVAAAVGAP